MTFQEFTKNRIVVFDGAMGTQIQEISIDEKIWDGRKGCNELLNIAQPELIAKIHHDYFLAGADVAVANSFGANRTVLLEYDLHDKVFELNKSAVAIAKNEAAKFKDKFVSLSIGPGTKLASLAQISYDELYDGYREQIEGGIEADIFNIETCQDTLQIKAAVNACIDTRKKYKKTTPIIVSVTVENNGCLLTGTDLETVANVCSSMDIFALGLNCALGPDLMIAPFTKLAENYSGRLYLSPNAGLPMTANGKTVYPMDAQHFTDIMSNIFKTIPLTIVGGCCGTDETHIEAMRKLVDSIRYNENKFEAKKGYVSSLYTSTSLVQRPSCAFIGERANATGSKAFRDMLLKDDIDSVLDIAKKQESEGAHFIDLSLAYTGRKEIDDYKKIMPLINQKLTAPIVIDSTDKAVILESLKRCSGKPIINSVNFEDGGKKLYEIFDIVKSHPAAMIALTIDEDGMAQKAEKKLNIAKRIYKVWTEEYGFDKEDLIIDPLTFSIGSGDQSLKTAAIETLEAIKLIATELKGVKTVLGLSNISFGLQAASRPILNSVFLDLAVKNGLDMAIAHSSKLTPIAKLTGADIAICEELIYNKRTDAIDRFINHFSETKTVEVKSYDNIPVKEQLKLKIINGDKSGVEELIAEILKEMEAAAIINDVLLPAMQEVGVAFGQGRILLPFVLQSAEAMKKSVSLLEPHIEKSEAKKADTVILATVKGDVHDIGKNLVDIILSNNGYCVLNLGIKVDVSEMIEAAKKHNAKAIGMSGLLVKSTLVMKDNLSAIKEQLGDIKVLLGGAALTKKYVDTECANILVNHVFYCKDAFDDILALEGKLKAAEDVEVAVNSKKITATSAPKKMDIEHSAPPTPPFYGAKIIWQYSLDRLLKFLNKASLFRSAWQYDLSTNEMIETAESEYQRLIKELTENNIIDAKACYGYFKAKRNGDRLIVYDNAREIHRITFDNVNGVSLIDAFINGEEDILPMQIVTVGQKVIEYSKHKFDNHGYKDYMQSHGLFTELAEALAHAVHDDIRRELAIHDDRLSMENILSYRYQGQRFSFGYQLMSDYRENKFIVDSLNANAIGITINSEYQMEPEFTTSAIILHKKGVRYF